MPISAKVSLKNLKDEVLNCKKCPDLVKTRIKPVPGIGASNARIILVGDFPTEKGAEKKGIPYTNDEDGKLIRKVIDKIELSLEKDIYITYLVKCTPRKINSSGKKEILSQPEQKHINKCVAYLSKEISIVTPHIIISLGLNISNVILKNFFSVDKKYKNINDIHMRVFENPSFKLVCFHSPKDVTLTKKISEKKYLEDFNYLSKLLKVV